jgi:3'-5' exoribonuclease
MSGMNRTLTPFHQLKSGEPDDCFVILTEKNAGKTRDGKPFFTCRFRDKKRNATAMIWQDGQFYNACKANWQVGQFYKIKATYQESERYGPQIEIALMREVKAEDHDYGFNPSDFIEHSRFNVDEMFVELETLLEAELQDEPLKSLVKDLLRQHESLVKQMPASLKNYYPFRGGWLEHTISVCRTVLLLIDRFRLVYPDLHPPLNRDVTLVAAALHELGRVQEIQIPENPEEPYGYTIPGRMTGFHFLTRDLVREGIARHPELNPEHVLLLDHLLISYLNLPEWGSPRLPMIPESLILHHADDLDAKLEMFQRCLTRDQSDGPFTERDAILGKPLFKARSV